LQNSAGTTGQLISRDLFFVIHSTFFGFHRSIPTLALPKLQLQLHNWPFTTANYILQLQKLSSVAC